MSGITPYRPTVGNAADGCLDAAADIAATLSQLRDHLVSLDRVGLTDLPAGRLQDLLVGYDIYVRMLDDALHEIAGRLRPSRAIHRSEVVLAGGDRR